MKNFKRTAISLSIKLTQIILLISFFTTDMSFISLLISNTVLEAVGFAVAMHYGKQDAKQGKRTQAASWYSNFEKMKRDFTSKSKSQGKWSSTSSSKKRSTLTYKQPSTSNVQTLLQQNY